MAQARKSRPTGKAKTPHASAFKWTPEIEGEILTRIGDGESLRKICGDDWLPSRETVHKRITNDTDFADRYARAREAQADTLVDQIIEIADDDSGDWEETENGPRLNAENIQRSKLRIDARKWMAGKLRPKAYGERIDHTSSDGSMSPAPSTIIIEAADDDSDDPSAEEAGTAIQ